MLVPCLRTPWWRVDNLGPTVRSVVHVRGLVPTCVVIRVLDVLLRLSASPLPPRLPMTFVVTPLTLVGVTPLETTLVCSRLCSVLFLLASGAWQSPFIPPCRWALRVMVTLPSCVNFPVQLLLVRRLMNVRTPGLSGVMHPLSTIPFTRLSRFDDRASTPHRSRLLVTLCMLAPTHVLAFLV